MDGTNNSITSTDESESKVNGFTVDSGNCKFSSSNTESVITTQTEELQFPSETSSEDSQNLLESENSSSDCLDSEVVEVPLSNCDDVNDIKFLKHQIEQLQCEIIKLEKENARLEADRCPELHELQLETLEKTILQQKQEIKRLQDSIKQNSEIFQKHTSQIKQEYDSKLERVRTN